MTIVNNNNYSVISELNVVGYTTVRPTRNVVQIRKYKFMTILFYWSTLKMFYPFGLVNKMAVLGYDVHPIEYTVLTTPINQMTVVTR